MEYTLHWESFQTWTKESMADLYQDTDYTDVTLITEDMQVFKSHRIILSSSSEFFKEILGKMKSFQGQTLYLKEIQGNILGLLLNFVYMGEVTVKQELIQQFLSTAVDLKIKGIDFEEKTLKEEKNEQDTSNSLIKGIVFEEKTSKDKKKDHIKEDSSDSLEMSTLQEIEMEIKLTEDQMKSENNTTDVTDTDGDRISSEKKEKKKIQKCPPKSEKRKPKKKKVAHYKKKLSDPLEVKGKDDSNNSEEEFICNSCDEIFQTSKEVKKHIMKIHRRPIKEKKAECGSCEKKFQTKHEAKLHWEYKHGNREKKFSCEICKKKFFQSGDLKIHHKGVHLKIKDFHCTFCDLSFTQNCNLKTHMIKMHTEKYYNQLQVKEPSADKI